MRVQIDTPSYVHPEAKIGNNTKIGRFCYIGPNVILKENVTVKPHAYIDGYTIIDDGCIIYPFASIGTACQDLKFKGERTFVRIGKNTTIRESVTVNSATGEDEATVVGSNCLIMAYSHVAHNCIVGDDVVIANAGTLAGHVTLGNHTIIGGLTAVHQFSRVGDYSIIGGCSKVVKDIPPFMMADGHPAKVHGLNSIGLKRHGFSAESRASLKKAFRILFRKGLNTKHAVQRIEQELSSDSELVVKLLEFISQSSRGLSR